MKKKPSKPSGYKAFSAPEPVKVKDSSAEQASGLWIKAVIVLGAAIFIGVKMEMNWIVDMNDPEFNPLTYKRQLQAETTEGTFQVVFDVPVEQR